MSVYVQEDDKETGNALLGKLEAGDVLATFGVKAEPAFYPAAGALYGGIPG